MTRPICVLLSVAAGVTLIVYELGHSHRPAVGPELVTDTVMRSVYLTVAAWLFALLSFWRRERYRVAAIIGVASPFVVLLVEGLAKHQ